MLREGQLQSLLEEVERLRGGSESKGKEVDRGESPFLLCEGMLTTDLEGLFAMIPRAESKLSYATPRSTLEPILSDEEEVSGVCLNSLLTMSQRNSVGVMIEGGGEARWMG